MHARSCAQVAHAAPPCLTWSRSFPTTARHVPEARHALAAFLEGFPAASDALVCASELTSNAILHSRSARPGGRFTLRAIRDGDRVRVEVEDDGGPWHSAPDPDGQHGRGLVVVAALATRWGKDGDGPRTVWFEIECP